MSEWLRPALPFKTPIAKMILDKPKTPKLPPPVPMPDPEDPVAKLEARKEATAKMASAGRQSTVLSSPSDRLTSNLGG